jgi:hypothetical protein
MSEVGEALAGKVPVVGKRARETVKDLLTSKSFKVGVVAQYDSLCSTKQWIVAMLLFSAFRRVHKSAQRKLLVSLKSRKLWKGEECLKRVLKAT